jgi:hypothetical protein
MAELMQLGLEPLPQACLDQVAEIIHEGIVGAVKHAHSVALTAHQARSLQLTQLAADVGLGETGGLDQGGHIPGTLLEFTDQPQASRLAEDAKELAEFLKQAGGSACPHREKNPSSWYGRQIIMPLKAAA